MGSKDLVDDTWRMPLRKVVVSRWLLDVGRTLTGHSLTYVPNGVDHERYRATQPIKQRGRQVVMRASPGGFRGSKEGIAALRTAKRKFLDLRVALFGISRRPSWVPRWMTFEYDPRHHGMGA